jgi:hypothetical protein
MLAFDLNRRQLSHANAVFRFLVNDWGTFLSLWPSVAGKSGRRGCMVPDATVFTSTELAGLDRLPRRRSLKVLYEFRMLPASRVSSSEHACQELWKHMVTITERGDEKLQPWIVISRRVAKR